VHEDFAALERLEPRGVGVPGRGGVEDGSAGDRRPRAEDDAVAPRGDDRARQAQLREAVSGPRDAGRGLRGAVVEHHARRDLAQGLERHVEPEARPEGARRDEDIAAAEFPPLHSGQGHGDALPRLGALDGPVVHLHAAHPHLTAARLDAQLVALADRP